MTASKRGRLRRQAGFTLVEVLVALVIFAISVVGLVALESRSIEAQKASAYMREAERVAQETMADLSSRGFIGLATIDFLGQPVTGFPYDDSAIAASARRRAFRSPPADTTTAAPGSVQGRFIVFRSVDWVVDPNNIPPVDQVASINALLLEVTVLWIDDTNPAYPPPATATVDSLDPSMIVPGSGNYQPYVGYVQLRTTRANDTILPAP